MSTENQLKSVTLLAGADLSAAQHKFVKLSADRTVVLAGDGELGVGVVQDNANSTSTGIAITVGYEGISKVKVGANAITANMIVKSDANGLADEAATGEQGLAIAVTGGASGAIIEVLLQKTGLAA